MRVVAAFPRREQAEARARVIQASSGRDLVIAVEVDSAKEPYAFRVVAFDLAAGETVPHVYSRVAGRRLVFLAARRTGRWERRAMQARRAPTFELGAGR